MPRYDSEQERRYYDDERETRGRTGQRRSFDDNSFARNERDDDRQRERRFGAGYGDYDEDRQRSDYSEGGSRDPNDWRSDYWRSDDARLQSRNEQGYGRFAQGGQYGEHQSGQGFNQYQRLGGQGFNQWDQTGPHRGKGPKGYKRTDARIREDVNDRLADDAVLDASEIDVEVKGGEVTLTGTVSQRTDKRRAEDLIEAVSGVAHVQNNLRLKQDTNSNDQETGERRTRQQS